MRYFIGALVTLLAGLAHPALAGAQTRPCPTPAPLGTAHLAVITEVITSTKAHYMRYADSMGVGGLTAAHLVVEDDPAVCTAVTDAIQLFLKETAASSNFLVVRAGSRYLAIDPTGNSSTIFSVSSSYDNVRLSF